VPKDVVRLDEMVHDVDGVVVVAPDPVRVRGDRAALERAVSNLVENARRHGKGQITVETRVSDGTARLTVADEGPGLRLEEAQLAFGRFWRGPAAGPGSGLGLAIVRATAERHGGRAYAEGPRFTIELPALREISESAPTTTAGEREKGSP
jgi:signal transduction histidine kinase